MRRGKPIVAVAATRVRIGRISGACIGGGIGGGVVGRIHIPELVGRCVAQTDLIVARIIAAAGIHNLHHLGGLEQLHLEIDIIGSR